MFTIMVVVRKKKEISEQEFRHVWKEIYWSSRDFS